MAEPWKGYVNHHSPENSVSPKLDFHFSIWDVSERDKKAVQSHVWKRQCHVFHFHLDSVSSVCTRKKKLQKVSKNQKSKRQEINKTTAIGSILFLSFRFRKHLWFKVWSLTLLCILDSLKLINWDLAKRCWNAESFSGGTRQHAKTSIYPYIDTLGVTILLLIAYIAKLWKRFHFCNILLKKTYSGRFSSLYPNSAEKARTDIDLNIVRHT